MITLLYADSKSLSSKIDSNAKELIEKTVQAEYVKHYLDAYLKRQVKLGKSSTILEPQEFKIEAKTSLTQAKEQTTQFDEDFKNSIRFIRRKQAASNSNKGQIDKKSRFFYMTNRNFK